MKKILLLLLALAVAGGGAWYLFGSGEKKGRVEVLETAQVERDSVRKVLEATGIIKAEVGAQIKIGARSTGEIEDMLVRIGDRVQKGDLIAVIDSREEKAQLDESNARLARARAELERVRRVYPLQIEEAEAELRLSQAELEFAEKTLRRQKRLVEQDLQAVEELDKAERDARTAAKRVAARQATLRRLNEEYERELNKAGESVREAQAALESARVRISYTEIHSPIDGIVSQVTAQEGETVVSGLQVSNLITVLDPTRLEMWIYVDETDVGQVERGMPVEFTVDAHPDTTFHGTIDRIYPEPEIRDNIVYYQAIVDLDEEEAGQLRPEMTTQCQIVVQELQDVVSLPNTALKWVGEKKVVFRVGQDGAAEQIDPDLGLEGLERSQILSGLAPGDDVATRIVLPEGAKTAGGGQ
ncbi:efflux RND transporter periplasmic adaptor subunit [Desulfohalovibrio reitneri]|uniref:efflux RND transporter periplasmic adaptor subunit n=1 Tax=Desulfohalovibrio reitneri TaxID=1307759 RepID=UPI0004A6FE6E|nr:efflux RND transporter periplasmic adaptor subunit [Desulfohalovibrio reitneri]